VNPERWVHVKALFASALERPPAERSAWLADTTRNDPTLAEDVERLLRADERAGVFLETPASIAALLPTPDRTAVALLPNQRLGRYEILDLIGTGGMGSVYRARDTLLRRIVALKLLHGVGGNGLPPRLLREARAASALNHPHICTVYGLEEADGHAFIVMEYIAGESLQALSKAGLTFAQVLKYGRQIADAVGHAHQQGVVHRDLKSSNVLITSAGQAKVLDFGIASQALHDDGAVDTSPISLAQFEAWAGTLPYMPPERLKGAAGEPPSDVWALGVMLFEMATGRLPFTGESALDVTTAILDAPTPALSSTVPREFADVVRRCLAKDPAERFATASTVGTALDRVATAERETSSSSFSRAAMVLAACLLAAAIAIVVYVVRGPAEASPTVASPPAAVRPAASTSVAVLPFQQLDPSQRDATLELGLADAIITTISGVPGVTVRPTSAVMPYAKETVNAIAAGRDLRVEAVVEGTLQRSGSQLQVSVRLLSVADSQSIWGHTFDVSDGDVLSVQRAIAEQVAKTLSPRLDQSVWNRLASHGTKNLDAYRAYLEGRFFWNERTEAGFQKAIASFERALSLDPKYAPAYAGLADCRTLLAIWGGEADLVRLAKAAALRAVQYDDSLPEGHGSLALVRWIYDWNWDEADREFRRALELNPNYATAHQWYAYFLASRSRFAESIAEIRRAREVDPLSLSIRTDLGELSAYAHQYDQAIAELQGVLDVAPNFPMAHDILGLTYVLQGRTTEGIAALERAHQIDSGPRIKSALAYAYGRAGNRARAEVLLREMEQIAKQRFVSQFNFGIVYTGMGDRDRAFAAFERAFQDRSDTMAILPTYPWLDPLHDDPRFATLLKRTEESRYVE
jgi:serine/threonine-protein kinase